MIFKRNQVTNRNDRGVSTEEQGMRRGFAKRTFGTFMMDETGRTLRINEAMADVLACRDDHPENLLLELYGDEADRRRFLGQLNETGRVKDCSLQRRTKDGRTQLLSVEANLTGGPGEEVVIEGVVSDITTFQEGLSSSSCPAGHRQVAGWSAGVCRLAGGVAHEFSNMLTVVIGYAEMLLEEPGLESCYRKDIEQIRLAAQRSSTITGRLLAYAGLQNHIPRAIDINDQIEQLLTIYEELVGAGINILWYPGSQLGPVMFDPAQLAELLTIFCTNSRDAMGGSGTLTISTSARRVTNTDEDVAPGDYVVLEVHDNGAGISRSALDHLYEPFFTTKKIGEGVGLGLAAASGIVRQNR